MATIILGEPRWITDEKGNKFPIFDGLSFEECLKVREHRTILQHMVDTDKRKFPVGENAHILDGYVYKFDVSKSDRRVKLISRWDYGDDVDV